MAKILMGLADKSLAGRVAGALDEKRHDLVPLEGLQPEDGPEAARSVAEAQADVVILDYWPKDAASVKLMQAVSEITSFSHPAFIFIESPGQEAAREEVIMTLNEGAQAFLGADFQPAALSNYVERAILGPGRMRPRALSQHENDESVNELEEALGQIRTRSRGFQKVISHLLTNPAGAKNRKVLVVSDSPYQLEMLKKILEDHNFQVFSAGNTTDGLDLVKSESLRIIVSDLELAGQTGIDFCQTVKFTQKIIPCFFVICTANQKKIPKVLTPGNGVDDCLLKPSGPTDILDFVSRVTMGILLL